MVKKVLIDSEQINKIITNLAKNIIKRNSNLGKIVFIGILTRGVYIANRIVSEIKKFKKTDIPIGSLDITFYRDDVGSIEKHPLAKETNIPFDIQGKKVILVDDVLFTGRSIRAALDSIMDFGRPQSIQLAVLVDRGHRELPIQSDYTGITIKTDYKDEIQVKLKETDKTDSVVLI